MLNLVQDRGAAAVQGLRAEVMRSSERVLGIAPIPIVQSPALIANEGAPRGHPERHLRGGKIPSRHERIRIRGQATLALKEPLSRGFAGVSSGGGHNPGQKSREFPFLWDFPGETGSLQTASRTIQSYSFEISSLVVGVRLGFPAKFGPHRLPEDSPGCVRQAFLAFARSSCPRQNSVFSSSLNNGAGSRRMSGADAFIALTLGIGQES